MAVAAAVAFAIFAWVVVGGMFRPCLRLRAAASPRFVAVAGAAGTWVAFGLCQGVALVPRGGGGADGAVVVKIR